MGEVDKMIITGGLGVLIGVLGVVYLIGWMTTGLPIGQTYTTVGTIELYEQSSWCGEHTWVVLKTLGGIEADITLVDYHELDLGRVYEITTVCERGGFLGLSNWYRVIQINELS